MTLSELIDALRELQDNLSAADWPAPDAAVYVKTQEARGRVTRVQVNTFGGIEVVATGLRPVVYYREALGQEYLCGAEWLDSTQEGQVYSWSHTYPTLKECFDEVERRCGEEGAHALQGFLGVYRPQ